MIRARTWRGILLWAILAAVTWHVSRGPSEPSLQPPEKPDIRLNYALYEFSGLLLDEQGDVRLSITAPILRNDANSGVGTVDSPEVHIQEQDDQWYITAESAIISPDREVVTLTGDVSLSRQSELTDQVLEIDTREVVLHVTPRTAATDAGVSIRQQDDWLQAVGMKLDMVNERYELLSEVRAHYETP